MGSFFDHPRDDYRKTHVVKKSVWGKETYCDPKTGKPLKNQQKVKDEKLKKAGWW